MKISFTKKTSRIYCISLSVVLLLSCYPLMMGVQIMNAYISKGFINVTDYPKYVIPYTPIAISLILSVALLPLVVRFFKKFSLPVISAFGTGVFLLSEILFEQITVFSIQEGAADVGSWQAYLCIATPEVTQTIEYKKTIGQSLMERYSPVFKIHFYLIAILIVIAVIGVIHGYEKMVREKNYDKKRPLIIQAVAVALFICLCIFACFTAFYRTGELNISTLSSWLMSSFFIIFGLTAGTYSGSLLYLKKTIYPQLIPALIASITTLVMYIGELVLMGGVLFKFGSGLIFDPIGACPFAPIDFVVITSSGAITYLILFLIRQKQNG